MDVNDRRADLFAQYAVSAISSGCHGHSGESFFRGTEPVGATVMTSFSMILARKPGPAR